MVARHDKAAKLITFILVASSFPLEYYEPENQEEWNEVYGKTKLMFS